VGLGRTGCFDRLLSIVGNSNYQKVSRPEPRRQVNFEKEEVRFLFVMQANLLDMKNQALLFVHEFLQRQHFILVLRPHPSYRYLVEPLRDLLIEMGLKDEQILIDENQKIANSLGGVDVTLLHSSTSIFDSIFCFVPVIILYVDGVENDQNLFLRMPGLKVISTAAQFSRIILSKELSISDSEEKFLKYNIDIDSDTCNELSKLI